MISFQESIHNIVQDKAHGSTFLLKKIINTIIKYQPSKPSMIWALHELQKTNPTMVIIHHFLNDIEPEIDSDYLKRIQAYAERWSNIGKFIGETVVGLLPKGALSVLTHSHSGLVSEVIGILKQQGSIHQIFQTESNPGGEGKIQAEVFRKMGLPVTLVADHLIWKIGKRVDVCLLGVDHFDQHKFVNKSGSHDLIKLSSQANFPVYVLGDSRKRVARVKPQGLFEAVPLVKNVKLITEINLED